MNRRQKSGGNHHRCPCLEIRGIMGMNMEVYMCLGVGMGLGVAYSDLIRPTGVSAYTR